LLTTAQRGRTPALQEAAEAAEVARQAEVELAAEIARAAEALMQVSCLN
jgi:hypothetical protein